MRLQPFAVLPVLAMLGCPADVTGDTDTDPPVENRAPEGGAVEIGPATTAQDLVATVTAESVDPEGDAVSYRYAWTRDGQPAAEIDGDTVPATQTARDQVWEVQVTPTDGDLDGAPFTAQVTVANSAPTITEVALVPELVFTDSVLTATPTGDDIDGDALTWTYGWTVDGDPAGDAAAIDGASAFAKGQALRLRVVASDGDLESEPWESDLITVLNTPPTAPSVALRPDPPTTARDLVCEVDTPAFDLDGDALVYSFAFEVDGVAYSGDTSETHHPGDTVPAASLAGNQEWTCSVTAYDGDDVGPAGTATSEPVFARCGPLMHTDPEQVVDGWTLCYVRGTDSADIRDTVCSELVAHLDAPVYGCWHGSGTYPHENGNNMLTNACRPGIQHWTTYGGWGGTSHIMTVCIQD